QVEGGDVTASADIYAFGVVLYEMMTGRLPFEGDTALSTVLKRFREAPVSPRHHTPGLAPQWEAAILRCLEREPCDRFASADHVTKALCAEKAPAPRSAGRRRLLVLASAVAAVALAAGGAWLARGRTTSAPAQVTTSIAVLPFVNMSSDKEQEYFSDGL